MNDLSMFSFALSLAACAASLLLLQKRVMAGIPATILTIPALVFSWIYFILVPAANVLFDVYVDEALFLEEPVQSFTRLNLFNAGLLLLASLGAFSVRTKPRRSGTEVDFSVVVPGLSVLLVTQVVLGIYTIFISGNVLRQSSRGELGASLVQYAFFESAPLAFCWLVTLYLAWKKVKPSRAVVAGLLLTELLLVLLLSSSRGSRVAMLSQLMFCAMIFQYSLYRFKVRDFIIAGLACAVMLPIYANYKYAGFEGLQEYVSGGRTSLVAEQYNDPVLFLVGDIGRADMQAPLLDRYLDGKFSANYIGETYIATLALFLPRDWRPESIRSKAVIGAEAQLQPGASATGYRGVISVDGVFQSSRIYGLFGEALLNFGLPALPVVFFLFGYIFRWCFVRLGSITTWRQLLTAPYLAFLPIFLLFYDSDNILIQTVSVWLVPAAALATFERLFGRRQTLASAPL